MRGARRPLRRHGVEPPRDRVHGGGRRRVTYWEYRPTIGWTRREAEIDAGELVRLGATPLLEDQVPALVALETLPGANHFDFPPGEIPPWRWHVDRR